MVRTFSMVLATVSALALVASSMAWPVSRTLRLKLVTLTSILADPMLSTMAFFALSSMLWSSRKVPEVRRSAATTPAAAAPPTMAGPQAVSWVPSTIAVTSDANRGYLDWRINLLLAKDNRWNRKGSAT